VEHAPGGDVVWLRSICCSRPNVLDLLIEELNEVVCIDVGVTFIFVKLVQRIRRYFYNEMRYINLRFTYLLTYRSSAAA